MAEYKSNYLTNVIYRIDFNDIEEINNNVALESIYEKINATGLFPNKNIHQMTEKSIQIESDSKSSVITNFIHKLNCQSNNAENIEINKRSIIINLKKYTNFSCFMKIIDIVHAAVADIKDKIKIKRLGVRYINEISLKEGLPFDNGNIISEKLTSKEIEFFSVEEQNHINRSLSQTSFIYDDYQVVFTNGYVNSQFPAKILKNEYLLDIDCFTNSCEFNDIKTIITKMNTEIITPFFEKSIKDALRNEMNKNK